MDIQLHPQMVGGIATLGYPR